jgi:hypothetical protein
MVGSALLFRYASPAIQASGDPRQIANVSGRNAGGGKSGDSLCYAARLNTVNPAKAPALGEGSQRRSGCTVAQFVP